MVPIMLSTLVACGGDDKPHLTYGTYILSSSAEVTNTKIIDYGALTLKMSPSSTSNSENFLLVLANPDGGCSCWNTFQPKLRKFINKNLSERYKKIP